MTRSEVFGKLRSMGIARAVVEFSGGGDEGGVDSITLEYQDGKSKEISEYYENTTWDSSAKKWVKPEGNPTEEESISVELSTPVYDKYHTFAGEFHVNGRVIWDVEKSKVTMEGQESVEEYEDFEDEV